MPPSPSPSNSLSIMSLFLSLSLILVREINDRIAQFLWLLTTDTVIKIRRAGEWLRE